MPRSPQPRQFVATLGLIAVLGVSHGSARAADVTYRGLDHAVVRVIALGTTDLHEFTEAGVTVKLAVPASGHGSGFMVSEDGLIVTAAHVIKDARHVAVIFPGSTQAYPARIVSVGADADYAFIRVLGQYTALAKLATEAEPLEVRQSMFAVGYPIDASRTEPQSTPGVVSSAMPDGTLQLAMTVNPGNSGGPVIDAEERVRGILVARANPEKGFSGMAWAVPNSLFRGELARILAGGEHLKDSAPLTSRGQRGLAEFAALLATEGHTLIRSSVGLEDAAATTVRQDQVSASADGLPFSPEAQLLAAGYFWNRYVIGRYSRDGSADGHHATAKSYAQKAVELEPALAQESELVKMLLDGGAPLRAAPAPRTSRATGGRAVYVRVEREPGSDPVALYATPDGSFTVEKCTAPCNTSLERGSTELGVGPPDSHQLGRTWLDVDGPTTTHVYYKSHRTSRAAGAALWAVLGVAGVGTVIGELSTHARDDEYGLLEFYPRTPVLVAGSVLFVAGTFAGIILLTRRDEVRLKVSPNVSTSSGGMSVGGSF
jgi:S1-C subfamily serine protease